MNVLRWLYFGLGVCGWIIFVVHVWQVMGWFYGIVSLIVGSTMLLDWFEDTIMSVCKLRRVVTYEKEA
jgi:hypothetical protein